MEFLSKTFSSLKHRDFRLFFIGQSVSLTGSWIHQTALSWLVYEITSSKLMLGVLAALTSLPMLVLSIPGGVIADRFPKKNIVILTQFLTMLFAAALSVIVYLKSYNIWNIVAISFLMSTAFSIDLPVRQAFMAEIVDKNTLMNAIALNSSMVNLARIIGPAIAGIVMVKYGVSWCFFLNALSFLAVLAALFYIKPVYAPVKKRTESILSYTLSGFNYVRQHKLLLNVMILMVFMGIFGWSYSILIPAFAKDILHQDSHGYAMLVTANGFGALMGALFVAYTGNSDQKRNIMNWGVYLFSVMLILMSFCKVYWICLVLAVGAGMGMLMYFSSSTAIIQSSVDDGFRGRVMGIWSLIFGGAMPVGGLFMGIVSQSLGVPATMMIGAIICPIFTAVLANIDVDEPEATPVSSI